MALPSTRSSLRSSLHGGLVVVEAANNDICAGSIGCALGLRASSHASMAGSDGTVQDENSVRVALRARPLISRELLEGARVCVTVDEAARCVTLGRDRRFTFDYAFGASSTQDQVYRECVAPLIEGCFEGYNATVLAYGQTGSGKTYSMGTGDILHVSEEQLGITPRVIRHLFDAIAVRGAHSMCQVRAQFIEIHNEELKDLLHPDILSKAMAIRESPDGEIRVVGAGERPADTAEELLQLLEIGSCARSTGATQMNELSSRSHAIFTIMLEQHVIGDGGSSPGEFRSAKLHLVDLAGSERTKKSGAVGTRFRETVTINQGLLSLGNVISALGDDRKRGGHVPYRASKLTRLLQGSLGGNSRTLMLACVSAADENLEESLNTLKYANRARNIRNSPTPNCGDSDAAGTQLCLRQLEVYELRSTLLQRVLEALPPALAADPDLHDLLLADLSSSHACATAMRRLRSASGLTTGCETSAPWSLTPGPIQQLQRPSAVAAGQQVERLQGLLQGARSDCDSAKTEASHLREAQVQMEQQLQGSLRVVDAVMRALAEAEARGSLQAAVREGIMHAVETAMSASVGMQRLPGATAVRRSLRSGQPSPSTSRRASNSITSSSVTVLVQQQQQQQAFRSSVHSHPLQMFAVGDSQPEEALAGTLRDRRSPAAQGLEEKVRALEARLIEAQDDLQRDEVIFADKMKELAEARQAAVDAEARGQEQERVHQDQVAGLMAELQRLQGRPEQLQPGNAGAADAASATQEVSQPPSRPRSSRGCASQRQQAAFVGLCSQDSSPGLTTVPGGGSPRQCAAVATANSPQLPTFQLQEDWQGQLHGLDGYEDACGEDGEVLTLARSFAAGLEGGDADAVVLYDDELLSYISETDYTDQQAGAMFEGDSHHHTEELRRVLHQRALAEAERSQLEAAALERQQAFDEHRGELEARMACLMADIADQEGEIESLRHAESQARELSQAYLARMQQLEAEIACKGEEVERLRRDLHAVEGDMLRTAEQRQQLRELYEARIAAVMDEMGALRKQLKDQDRLRLEKERLKALGRAQQLEGELSRLRAQQAEVQRQLSDRAQAHERDTVQRQREVAGLRRAADVARKRLAELEQENREQRVQLRQKQLEMKQAQKRLKDIAADTSARTHNSSSGGSGGGSPAAMVAMAAARRAGANPAGRSPCTPTGLRRHASSPGGGSGNWEQATLLLSPSAARSSALGPGPSGPPTPTQKSSQRWLPLQVRALAGLKEWEHKLSRLAARGTEIRTTHAALLAERSQRQLKVMRRSAELRSRAAALDGHLEKLLADIPQAQAAAEGRGDDASMARHQQLLQRSADLSHERGQLEGRLRLRQLLSEEEQQDCDALDDRLDALEAELEFVGGEEAACHAALQRATAAAQELKRRAATLPAAELRTAMQHMVEALASRTSECSDAAGRAALLEAALHSSATQLAELQSSVRFREAEFERRLAAAQQAQAQRMQGVLSRLAPLMAGAAGADAANLAASLASFANGEANSTAALQSSVDCSVTSSLGLGSTDLRQLIKMYRDRTGSSAGGAPVSVPAADPKPPAQDLMSASSTAERSSTPGSATSGSEAHDRTSGAAVACAAPPPRPPSPQPPRPPSPQQQQRRQGGTGVAVRGGQHAVQALDITPWAVLGAAALPPRAPGMAGVVRSPSGVDQGRQAGALPSLLVTPQVLGRLKAAARVKGLLVGRGGDQA